MESFKCCQKPSVIHGFHVEATVVMMVAGDWPDWAEGDESMGG